MPTGSMLLVSADAEYAAHFLSLAQGRPARVVGSLAEAASALGALAFDAVLVDLDLGGARDLSLVTAVRELSVFSAIIALTSGDPEPVAFEAMRYGAEECLSKQGDDRARVVKVVRRAVDRMWLRGFFERREQLLESAFAALSPNIAVVDQQGVLVLANQSWERLSKNGGAELGGCTTGANYREALERRASSDATSRELLVGLSSVLSGEELHYRGEYRRSGPGGPKWYLTQIDRMPGSDSGVVVSHTDITDRKSVEAALQRSDADFRTLLDSFPQGLAIHRQGKVVWVNRQFLDALGYSDARQVLGRHALDLVHPDDHAAVIARLQRTSAGESVPVIEQRLLRADGTSVVAEVAAFPIFFEGHPAVLVMVADPKPRRALTAQLMQADRMHSVGLLALGLGHEINNPLSLVTANVDLAYRKAAQVERLTQGPSAAKMDSRALEALFELTDALAEIREMLAEAREGGRRVQEIVSELRTFSRPEEDSIRPVRVERVLDAALGIVRNEIRHRARIVKSYDEVPAVLGNDARLGQVFLNLLVNAAHSIPVGAADRHVIQIRVSFADPSVVVEIEDTGAGIADEHLPRLFEPFFTTKPAGQGTGLGLAICRDIVLRLGGSIEVESALGRGTLFRVRLRRSPDAAPTRPPTSDPAQVEPLRSLRVLVVDDEPLIGRVVKRCFGKAHDVQWVGSGREALECLRETTRWDVVFLDVMMPEMSGIDVYGDIERRASPHLERIVFLTGGAFAPGGEEFLERTGRPRVAKPFEARELVAVAKEVARRGSSKP